MAREGLLEEPATHVETTPGCAHCGDDCGETPITSGDQFFCCLGCRTVYDIIHDNGLEAYYSIESQPGISRKKKADQDFLFLDQADYFSIRPKSDVRSLIMIASSLRRSN